MNQATLSVVTIMVVVAAIGIALSFIVDRWIIPWRAKRTVDRLLHEAIHENKPSNPRIREDSQYGTIVADETGFQISINGEVTQKIPWTEVTEIHAYKRDLFSVDLICQALRMKSDGLFYEVHEEMSGYHDLQLAMERYLPTYDRLGWFIEVASPAFETNYQVVWTRYLKDDASQSIQPAG